MLKFIGAALVVLLVSGASVAGIVFNQLRTDLATNTVTLVGETEGPPPQIAGIKGGFNILIVGSDQCETKSGCRGFGDRGAGKLNDVTMLLHVSEDQTNAVAVSFPRDLIVPIPSCPKEDGSGYTGAAAGQPINVTLSYGGLPCTVLTVEALTGLDIQFAGLITFNGVIAMSNAVGGVKVCLANDLDDMYTRLKLSKGTHTLKGQKALDFLRSRHGIGDGSDLTRISSQQVYLSSLVRTLQSKNTLTDPSKVYKIAKAAAKNMQLSKNLASVDTMVSVALALKNLPLERVTFVQYPGTTGAGGIYAGKVAPIATQANQLFTYIKNDEPFKLDAAGDGRGSEADPSKSSGGKKSTNKPSATSTSTAKPIDNSKLPTLGGVRGQTAADRTCSVPR